jgi:glycosyltransferase involved in cell wall biosynthesis
MKIGIDARCLEGRRTGVGRYLANLLKRWAETAPHNVYCLYTKHETPDDSFLDAQCFVKKTVGGPLLKKGPLWEQIALRKSLAEDGVEVFFAPAYTAPLRSNCPFAVAIHDVSYEAHPEWYPFLQRLYFRYFSRRASARAGYVITDSKDAKHEMTKYYNLAEDKVKVIPLAADTVFKPIEDLGKIEATKRELGISGRFLLYVGMIFTRRNIPVLLDAFSTVRKEAPDCALVLIGKNETEPRINIAQLLISRGLDQSVILHEYVAQSDVVNLYNGTAGFVYLSTYEGFGLPVLEAMQCGAPVITADASCLPEIAGGAAILVNPNKADDVAKALNTVLADENLRDELKRRGLKRAADFSWDKTARLTLETLEALIQ